MDNRDLPHQGEGGQGTLAEEQINRRLLVLRHSTPEQHQIISNLSPDIIRYALIENLSGENIQAIATTVDGDTTTNQMVPIGSNQTQLPTHSSASIPGQVPPLSYASQCRRNIQTIDIMELTGKIVKYLPRLVCYIRRLALEPNANASEVLRSVGNVQDLTGVLIRMQSNLGDPWTKKKKLESSKVVCNASIMASGLVAQLPLSLVPDFITNVVQELTSGINLGIFSGSPPLLEMPQSGHGAGPSHTAGHGAGPSHTAAGHGSDPSHTAGHGSDPSHTAGEDGSDPSHTAGHEGDRNVRRRTE